MPGPYPYRHARNRQRRPLGFDITPEPVHIINGDFEDGQWLWLEWSAPIIYAAAPSDVSALLGFQFPDVISQIASAQQVSATRWRFEAATSWDFVSFMTLYSAADISSPGDQIIRVPDTFQMPSL